MLKTLETAMFQHSDKCLNEEAFEWEPEGIETTSTPDARYAHKQTEPAVSKTVTLGRRKPFRERKRPSRYPDYTACGNIQCHAA